MFCNILLYTFLFVSVSSTTYFIEIFEKWVNQFHIDIHNHTHFIEIYSKWVNNHLHIEEINRKNLSYQLGHNQFSGMDTRDFQEYLGLKRMYNEIDYLQSIKIKSNNTFQEESVNWVEKGAVTSVKDQGQCGSCWSFSTTGSLEGAFFIKYGKLQSFSEQQLVDCDNFKNGGKDLGCNGGFMDNAFTWISKNGGLCIEDEYPYISGTTKKSGVCQKTCSVISQSQIQNFVDVTPSSDNDMMNALTQQPVSIAIEADEIDFQLYKSGVFTGKCGTNLDHGVLVVGYGSDNGEDYYIVKNSWGTTWGMNGYILLGRGLKYNNGDGQCGMLLQGSYPILV